MILRTSNDYIVYNSITYNKDVMLTSRFTYI